MIKSEINALRKEDNIDRTLGLLRWGFKVAGKYADEIKEAVDEDVIKRFGAPPTQPQSAHQDSSEPSKTSSRLLQTPVLRIHYLRDVPGALTPESMEGASRPQQQFNIVLGTENLEDLETVNVWLGQRINKRTSRRPAQPVTIVYGPWTEHVRKTFMVCCALALVGA